MNDVLIAFMAFVTLFEFGVILWLWHALGSALIDGHD